MKAVTSSVKKEVRAYSKGQSLWRNMTALQKWKKIWKRKRTNSNHVRYRNLHKQSQANTLVLSAIFNTWLPRSNFIYSNNTLLTAECCKSQLRSLKHWYHLLCPGLVKPILGYSLGRSSLRTEDAFPVVVSLPKAEAGIWYMRLFHTPRTSFL